MTTSHCFILQILLENKEVKKKKGMMRKRKKMIIWKNKENIKIELTDKSMSSMWSQIWESEIGNLFLLYYILIGFC